MVTCNFTENVFKFLLRFKLFILIFWIVLAVISCFYGLDLPNQTVFQFLPPSGSESDIAYNQMRQYFPDYLFLDTEVIVIKAKWEVNDNNNILNDKTNKIVNILNNSIWNIVNPKYNLLLDIQSYYSTSNISKPHINYNINNTNYNTYNYSAQYFINMAAQQKYVDENKDVMLVFIQSNINHASTQTLNGFIDDIKYQIDSIKNDYPEYYIVLTGGITIFKQSMEVITDDITTKDLFVLPLIFCFMMYMIGSWKLIILPAMSLGMTMIISFGLYYPFAIYLLEVNPMAPSLMMFLSMALSIDYSMFLLSRFAEERSKHQSVNESVKIMLKYSAHVVGLSGIILIICYMSIVFFPISGMETVAYGTAIAIFLCIAINITFTSSAILLFPNFFGKLETFPPFLVKCCKCCLRKNKKFKKLNKNEKLLTINDGGITMIAYHDDHNNNDNENDEKLNMVGQKTDALELSAVALVDNDSLVIAKEEEKSVSDTNLNDEIKEAKTRSNCYFKLTQYTTRWPFNCIVPFIVYLLMAPIIYILFTDYVPSIDFTMNFPMDVSSVDAYNILIEDFNPGDMMPMYIIVVSKEDTIWSLNYMNALCEIGNKLIEMKYENNTQMTSIGFVPNIGNGGLECITKESTILAYKTLINNPSLYIGDYTQSTYWQTYMKWWNKTVNNPQQTMSYILAIPNFNPYTGDALQHCEDYRDAINEVASRENIQKYVNIYLHQSLYWEIDSLYKTNETLPYSLTIIIVIVFVLIGLVFRAIFLPFRLFLCIIIPILFIYGCIVCVYQNGWLNWLGWSSLSSSDGIYWMLPVITCTVLCGLALDYEIFLYSRIFEYRSKGYTTKASIILGVSTTGPIISAAGTVMSMAFSGLLLETIVASNQMGLVFVFGVLCDTFIIRPMVVPSVLSFADKLNWYPTKMPIPTKNEYNKLINK